MSEIMNYADAVQVIKTAILQSQYEAAKSVNEKQLMLYYGIGKYISFNSRNGTWGQGAIDIISRQLDKELPGLRGFSARNLRYMRTFYEEWKMLEGDENSTLLSENANLAVATAKLKADDEKEIWQLQLPKESGFPQKAFLSIGFTQHNLILTKVKDYDERLFYIQRCADEHYSVDALKRSISADDYRHQGKLPNNFYQTLPASQQALRAVNVFKDEYLLDYINIEEIGVRDREDIDERVVENAIVHNIKQFNSVDRILKTLLKLSQFSV